MSKKKFVSAVDRMITPDTIVDKPEENNTNVIKEVEAVSEVKGHTEEIEEKNSVSVDTVEPENEAIKELTITEEKQPTEKQNSKKKQKENNPPVRLKKNGEPAKPVGRKKVKEEETRTINIAVPISVMSKVDIALEVFDNNLTKYVNTLIERDLAENFETYQRITEQLRQLKQLDIIK